MISDATGHGGLMILFAACHAFSCRRAEANLRCGAIRAVGIGGAGRAATIRATHRGRGWTLKGVWPRGGACPGRGIDRHHVFGSRVLTRAKHDAQERENLPHWISSAPMSAGMPVGLGLGWPS